MLNASCNLPFKKAICELDINFDNCLQILQSFNKITVNIYSKVVLDLCWLFKLKESYGR